MRLEINNRLRGFSLLETLIATGILIMVSAATVALSNSLIQGTVVSADKTVANRLAAEGLELISKIRDDNFKSNSPLWFDQAENSNQYGWYVLEREFGGEGGSLRLNRGALGNDNELSRSAIVSNGEVITSGGMTLWRVICIEAISAVSQSDQGLDSRSKIPCNIKDNQRVNDGERDYQPQFSGGQCAQGDLYCSMTKTSLNRNRLAALERIIPAGNAIKVRSVVVWLERDLYRSSDVATVITNWEPQ